MNIIADFQTISTVLLIFAKKKQFEIGAQCHKSRNLPLCHILFIVYNCYD